MFVLIPISFHAWDDQPPINPINVEWAPSLRFQHWQVLQTNYEQNLKTWYKTPKFGASYGLIWKWWGKRHRSRFHPGNTTFRHLFLGPEQWLSFPLSVPGISQNFRLGQVVRLPPCGYCRRGRSHGATWLEIWSLELHFLYFFCLIDPNSSGWWYHILGRVIMTSVWRHWNDG